VDFKCVQDCSQCCIDREYYPAKRFGKVGVLILPEEKENIEHLAKKNGLKITILPRIGISYEKSNKPTKIKPKGDPPTVALCAKYIKTDLMHAWPIL